MLVTNFFSCVPRALLLAAAVLAAGCQGFRDLDRWWQHQVAALDSEQRVEAVYAEGLQLSLRGDRKAAVKKYRQAAQGGHRGARYLLGMSYLAGQGVERDPRQALVWLEPLATTGHAGAQYHVGEIYMNGAGVAVERAWAVHWYERAARLGFGKAQLAAGVAYFSGMAGITDRHQGWFWLLQAQRDQQPHASALLERLKARLTKAERRRIGQQAAAWAAAEVEQEVPSGLVRFVQYVVGRQGFVPGPPDGLWGPKTAAAVAAFQRRAGLVAAGLDEATLLALRATVRDGGI